MATILPAILVDSLEEYQQRVKVLPESVDTISVDIMDGTFVEPSTFHDIEDAINVQHEFSIELDIMANDPLPIIKEWARDPRVIRAMVHAEIDVQLRDLLIDIKQLGLEVGLALLPKTTLADVEYLLNDVDMVLLRGNEPGYSGRPLLPAIIEKVKDFHTYDPHLMINVDIGVNKETIPDLVAAGASHLSVNSAIFKESDPITELNFLQNLAN